MKCIPCNPSSILLPLTLALGLMYNGCQGQTSGLTDQPDDANSVFLADPTIFFYDNVYYLYGTSGHDPDQGFEVYASNDMLSWQSPEEAINGYALRKEDVFGDRGF